MLGVKKGDVYIVATSSGPDSMYLLSRLIKLKSKFDLNIVCAYVNHQTRDKCDLEESFLRDYCARADIIFESTKIDRYLKGHFTEEEARRFRIDYFVSLANKYQATSVMLAHHADDLMETILMKLIRGSTLFSVAGIKECEYFKGVLFKRPLLHMSKDDILLGLKEDKVPYFVDESNLKDENIRNRLRHNVCRYLKSEYENVHLKFLKFSKELGECGEYISKTLDIIDKDIKFEGRICLSKFLALDLFLQKMFLQRQLLVLYGDDITCVNEKVLSGILKFLDHHLKNYYLLPLDYEVNISGDYFFFGKNGYESYCYVLGDELCLSNGYVVKKSLEYVEKSNYEIHLNSKDISLPLYITTRKPGMKMAVKNLNGHKKVKDILIDEKIAHLYKDSIPIMVDNSGKVLWMLGVKKSKYDLDKNEKYDIIYRYEGRKKK